MPTVLKILKIGGTPIDFTTQQPSVVPPFPPAATQSKKPSHIPSSVLSDYPSGSTSVDVSVNPIHFPSITTTTLTSYVQSDKPIKKPSINSLQAPTGVIMYKHNDESL